MFCKWQSTQVQSSNVKVFLGGGINLAVPLSGVTRPKPEDHVRSLLRSQFANKLKSEIKILRLTVS